MDPYKYAEQLVSGMEKRILAEIRKNKSAVQNDFRMGNKRVSPPASITKEQHAANGVDDAALSSGGADADRAVGNTHIKTGAVRAEHFRDKEIPGGKIEDDAITEARLSNGAVAEAKLQNDAVKTAKLGTGAVTDAKISNDMNGGAQSAYRLRLIEGPGSSGAAAAHNHSHSVPFTWLDRAERVRINDLALTLRGHRDKATGSLRDVLTALDDVLHMLCDDPDMDRWQREHLLSDPARLDEAKKYRRKHLMHHDGPTEPSPADAEVDPEEWDRQKSEDTTEEAEAARHQQRHPA